MLNNARSSCLTAAAGTGIGRNLILHTTILFMFRMMCDGFYELTSSPNKTSLSHTSVHCSRFPTAAPRRGSGHFHSRCGCADTNNSYRSTAWWAFTTTNNLIGPTHLSYKASKIFYPSTFYRTVSIEGFSTFSSCYGSCIKHPGAAPTKP